MNPIGRTGMVGRGLHWRWGPNHLATSFFTKWARDEENDVIHKNGKPVLEFVMSHSKKNPDWLEASSGPTTMEEPIVHSEFASAVPQYLITGYSAKNIRKLCGDYEPIYKEK